MTVAGHFGSQSDERGSPKLHGGRIGAGTAAPKQFAEYSAHGFDRVRGLGQVQAGMREIGPIEMHVLKKSAHGCFNAPRSAVASGQASQPIHYPRQAFARGKFDGGTN